jgi:hypothetical protein
MTDNDQCRAEFEAWMVSRWDKSDLGKEFIETLSDGSYRSTITRHEWRAWQAAWNTRGNQQKEQSDE